MAVPKGKRSTGVFETGTKAKELLMHTLRITKNEKCFPVRYRYTVTNRIINDASEVYGKVRRANAIFPTNAAEYQMRRKWQLEAYAALDDLAGYIEVAHEMFSIDTDKITYWTKLTRDTRYSIKRWVEGDLKRYKHLLQQGR